MSRFFAFGCSMTCYLWASWSDLLSPNFDEYQNWGKSGAGNRYIFESLIEAITTQKITTGDTVWIMWSGPHRFDLYRNDEWVTEGNMFTSKWIMYADELWDEKGFHLNTFNYIASAQRILDQIGVTWYMTSMTDLTQTVDEGENESQGVFDDWGELRVYERFLDPFLDKSYKNSYMSIPSFSQREWKVTNWSTKPYYDGHPQPIHAAQWLQNIIQEHSLPYTIDAKFVAFSQNFQSKFDDFHEAHAAWGEYVEKQGWSPKRV